MEDFKRICACLLLVRITPEGTGNRRALHSVQSGSISTACDAKICIDVSEKGGGKIQNSTLPLCPGPSSTGGCVGKCYLI